LWPVDPKQLVCFLPRVGSGRASAKSLATMRKIIYAYPVVQAVRDA
jgi:hypothetical protein